MDYRVICMIKIPPYIIQVLRFVCGETDKVLKSCVVCLIEWRIKERPREARLTLVQVNAHHSFHSVSRCPWFNSLPITALCLPSRRRFDVTSITINWVGRERFVILLENSNLHNRNMTNKLCPCQVDGRFKGNSQRSQVTLHWKLIKS